MEWKRIFYYKATDTIIADIWFSTQGILNDEINCIYFKIIFKGLLTYRTEMDQPLMTAALRQQQKEVRMQKYPRVIIRVHFPERIMLQGVFNVRESGT